jgi:hypothetical protein
MLPVATTTKLGFVCTALYNAEAMTGLADAQWGGGNNSIWLKPLSQYKNCLYYKFYGPAQQENGNFRVGKKASLELTR